jgi:hypothetical protein
MAINFLDNLQFNQNQLLGARLQNEVNVTGISSPVVGQILYETSTNKFKYYGVATGASTPSWISVSDGGTWNAKGDDNVNRAVASGNTVTFSGGTGMSTTTTSPTSGIYVISFTNDLATSSARGGIQIGFTESGKNYPVELSSEKAFVNVPWTDTNTNTTYTLPTSLPTANTGRITLTGSDGSTDTVNFAGTTNEIEVTQPTSGVLAIGLPSNVTLTGDLTVSGGDITLGGAGRIQGVDTVTAATDAASKNYVDTQLAGSGLLIFQGGYNAATNTPNLDNTPTLDIKKGWSYVVTNAGSFFTETVEVGDLLIAEQDDPTTLAHWTTVQNNIGLATATTPGIAEFPTNGGLTVSAGAVSIDGIGSPGTGGASATATTGVTINARGQVTGFTSQNIAIPHTQITDFDTEVVAKITAREFKASNASAGTSHTFTHNLASTDVIVQLYDVTEAGSTEGQTLNATVDRTSNNVVTVTTASSIGASSMRALIIKID